MNTQLTYLLIGALGVFFHSLLKLNSLQTDARTANIDFDPFKDYLLKDLFGILASFCSVFVWYFLFEEVAAKYPAIGGFTKVSFFVMGAMGSYILQLLLSKAKKQIRSVVDIKTNQADGVKPPVNNSNKDGLEMLHTPSINDQQLGA